TQGGNLAAQLLSYFIDVTEVNDFVEKACQSGNLTWNREARPLVVKGNVQVADLIKRLENPKSKYRHKAAELLAAYGPDAKLGVPALVKALKDPDDLLRLLARQALSKIGTPDKNEVPLLTESLKDSKLEVRTYAAEALGMIGPGAQSAAAALLQALKEG